MRWLVLAAAMVVGAGFGRAEVLDAIVARVDQSAVTWSEVLQEAELVRLSGEGEPGADPAGTVEALVRRRLLVVEARRMRLEVPAAATAAAVRALVEAAGGADALRRRLGLREADVARRAEEILLMRRYLTLRQEMTYVPESEVRAYYAQEAESLGGRPLSEVRDEVRALLAGRKHREELDQWLARQRTDGRVRLQELPGPGRPGEG